MKGESDVVGRTMSDKEFCEQGQHVIAVQPPSYEGRQTFATELVDHHQHPKRPTIMGTFLDKVVSPDMMPPTRPKSDAGTIVEPKPATIGLSRRHL